jgi:basic membrane protein A
MRKTKRFTSLAAVALLGLMAAACGSDDEDSATTDAAGVTAAPDATTAPDGTTAAPSGDAPTVGLVYDTTGRGDQSFNDAAAAGLERAKSELGVTFTEAVPNEDGSNRKELLDLAAASSDIIIGVGFLFEGDAAAVGKANPDKTFGVVDSSMLDFTTDPTGATPYGDNIVGLVFSEEQGSFLVGAAAALKSTTGKLGFIGGVKNVGGLIEKFEAGFKAGAKAVNPDIQVVSNYITEAPDFDGFTAPDQARDIATAMYDGGADVVYHAAGASGAGLFEAAKASSDAKGTKLWAIGVDSDQYNTSDPAVKDYILTSMLKRVDVAVFELIKAQMDGNIKGGPIRYDLSVDGVGYATSGGFVDDIADQLETFKADIVSGKIVVPTDPTQV